VAAAAPTTLAGMVKIAPYGSWTSPITASDVASAADSPQWVGWHRGETIRAALEAELSFYGQVFGFTAAGVPELELRS